MRTTKGKVKKAPVARKPRLWVHVVPRGTGKGREWAVLQAGSHRGPPRAARQLAIEETKHRALTVAREIAWLHWHEGHTPVQVIIHRIDGVIQRDRTYGFDPRRSRG